MHRRKRIIEVALFALLLGLALFLRVRRLDTTEIWGDQSFLLNTAMRWVNGGAMPLAANKSSAGFMHLPMIEYLYAAVLHVWPDILGVAVLTMLSGMAAIAAAGWAAYKVFGQRAAFWTVLIFTVNPWSVFYSQFIWNPTMAPIFAALTFACLLLYFAVEQRAIYLILSFVWAACMTQVHPGTMAQLLTMGLLFALFWRKLRVWPLAAGVAIFALMYAPFLLYESGVGWIDVKAALEVARQPASLSAAALLVSADLLHARGLLGSARQALQFDTLATVLLAISLTYALGAAALAFARRRDPKAARQATGFCILLLWFILPILFYLRSAHYLQIYYLIGQIPAHFLLIGVCLAGIQRALERSARRAIQVAAWTILPLPLLLLAGWQFAFNLQFQDHRFQSHEGLTQIRHIRAATQMARRLLAERPECDLVVLSAGHNLETSELSLLREFTVPERVLLADGRLAVPAPAPCAIYLDALPESRASTWLARAATPFPEDALQVLDETWRFYDLPPDVRAGLVKEMASESQLARFANGVALTGYERGQVVAGAPLPLTLTWLVEAQPPEAVYHIGAYLLTPDDQVVAQSDGPGFDSIQWRAGDAFVTWFDVPVPQDLPPGDYQIAVAFYSWPGLERVDLASGGNTAFLERLQVSAP